MSDIGIESGQVLTAKESIIQPITEDEVNFNIATEEADVEAIVGSSPFLAETPPLGACQTSCGKLLGFFFTFLHLVAFSVSGLLATFLPDYHPLSLSLYRFLGLFIPSLLYTIGHTINEYLKPKEDRVLITSGVETFNTIFFLSLRGIFGCTSSGMLMYSLRYISLGDTMVIQAADPIFTTILAHFILKESLGIVQIGCGVLSILGVGIISHPPILTGADTFDGKILTGCAISLGSMLLTVVSVLILRYLKGVHLILISFMFGMTGTLTTFAVALPMNALQFPIGAKDITTATCMGLLVFASQVTLTLALKREAAGPVMLVRTLHCVVAFVLQKIFLNIPADMYSIIGAFLVLFGAMATILRKHVDSLPEEHTLRKHLAWILY